MIPFNKRLWTDGEGEQTHGRDTFTDVCLNCPMPPSACEEKSKSRGEYRQARRTGQSEPVCLIHVAYFYDIAGEDANSIALGTIGRGMSDKAYRRSCRLMADRRECLSGLVIDPKLVSCYHEARR